MQRISTYLLTLSACLVFAAYANAQTPAKINPDGRLYSSKEADAKALFESLQKDQRLIKSQTSKAADTKNNQIKRRCLNRLLRLPTQPLESLANKLRVNPNLITLVSTTYQSGVCTGKVYTPRGVCTIFIQFASSSIYPTGFTHHGCR